ncbi:MAG TPA: hypothetical protein VLJ38_04865 [Polyangiaceae bacterium]|nr:hypothetical protein [Polyangiaceae bacterium]
MPAPVGKQALTAVFPVLAESSATIGASIEAVSAALCAKLATAESVHAARFVLLDGPGASGQGAATLLLFATIFDGSTQAHLDELWSYGALELEGVLAQCAGWARPSTRASFGRFVSAHARPVAALFSAHVERTVPQIREDFALRSALSRWLSEHERELRVLAPAEIVRRAGERFDVPREGTATREGTEKRDAAVRQVGASQLALGEWVAFGVTFLRSCIHDVGDLFGGLWHDTLTSSGSVPSLTAGATGTSGSVRTFSHVVEVKAGRFRRRALRLVLRLLDKLSQATSARGKVLGVEAVQSASFMLLEDGRLIFLADFDASVESVLERVAERAPGLVGMIWSQTRGFPISFGWYRGGARDTAKLRDFARQGRLRTPFGYSGYSALGARQIRENAEIRRLFDGALDDARARRLLSLVRD